MCQGSGGGAVIYFMLLPRLSLHLRIRTTGTELLVSNRLIHDMQLAYSASEGWCVEKGMNDGMDTVESIKTGRTAIDRPPGTIDDVLALLHLVIVVSGGDFKADCLKWWAKALRLAEMQGLDREEQDGLSESHTFYITHVDKVSEIVYDNPLAEFEAKEERRRAWWLLYCVDRHLAVSYNANLSITEGSYHVLAPLPENVWQNLESHFPFTGSRSDHGPPIQITGVGFFEYFLPLMVILGDIIEIHHRRSPPPFRKA